MHEVHVHVGLVLVRAGLVRAGLVRAGLGLSCQGLNLGVRLPGLNYNSGPSCIMNSHTKQTPAVKCGFKQ